MRKLGIIFLIIIALVVVAGVVRFMLQRNTAESRIDSSGKNTTQTKSQKNERVVFTNQMFDPALVSHITPLGELNGGYEEATAITGVMINNKMDAVAGGKMIDVFAPMAMTLETYSYHYDPMDEKNIDWTLIFRLNKNTTIKFDHITQAVDKIVAATTSTPSNNSREEHPKQPVDFEAGEKIAQTRGTSLAKNWNIYMYDGSQTNTFINKTRYAQEFEYSAGYKFTHGVCPFEYYSQDTKAAYLALMGATKAGEASDCGTVSRDVAGTISGMWHFSKEVGEIREELDGQYASPLSVYKNSAGQIIIDQLADVRFDLQGAADPAAVKESQCYALVNSENRPAGYAFFKLNSEAEMQLAYAPSDTCPATFPATSAKTYYR